MSESIVYVGRRVTSKGTFGHFFMKTDGSLIGFAKRPRTVIGWPIGTIFNADNAGKGQWVVLEQIGQSTPQKQKEWVLEDRGQEVQHQAELAKKQMVKGEVKLIDDMTLNEIRDLLATTAMPGKRRAIVAILLQRIGIY